MGRDAVDGAHRSHGKHRPGRLVPEHSLSGGRPRPSRYIQHDPRAGPGGTGDAGGARLAARYTGQRGRHAPAGARRSGREAAPQPHPAHVGPGPGCGRGHAHHRRPGRGLRFEHGAARRGGRRGGPSVGRAHADPEGVRATAEHPVDGPDDRHPGDGPRVRPVLCDPQHSLAAQLPRRDEQRGVHLDGRGERGGRNGPSGGRGPLVRQRLFRPARPAVPLYRRR